MAASPEIGALGVGATYSGAIEPLIERRPELFHVLEIEPQTLWIKTSDPQKPYLVEDQLLDHLTRLPGRKIIHSVGLPVGGTLEPESAQLDLVNDTIRHFNAPWVSDHLSFNQTPNFATGFFLPPRQTLAGVRTASASIRSLQDGLIVPVAVETGVNYLRPRNDELADGEFVTRVVETADCGLLLDLHNVFCNAVNGRQPLQEYLSQLSLDRVWEIHLAGGLNLDNFYLDAHSGAVPDSLYPVLEELMPRLPNLKAIVFEIFPSFVSIVGLDLVEEQLERLHVIWAQRKPSENLHSSTTPSRVVPTAPDFISPATWERTLGALVIGREPDSELERELANDPGVRIVERLIHEFRASMIVRVLPLTSRLLMLALGTTAFRTILSDYWSKVTPQMYASMEADAFCRYLETLNLPVPHLAKILEFERAATATIKDGTDRIVHFEFEPLPLLRALAEGRLPETAGELGNFEIELTADDLNGSAGADPEAVRQTFPFH